MAATGYTPIQLYYSSTPTNVPVNTNLASGELAINITDGKLFYKDNAGVVQVIATKAGANGDVVGPASATDDAVVRFDGTTGKLVQNSAVTIADTTGDITGGKYNKVTITSPATSATLTIADGKTLTANNTLTLAGTDATTMTFPGTTTTVAGLGIAQTFTASQRGTVTTDNDGSFDMNVTNNFKCTPTGSITLTFTNITSGQTGNILLVNGSNYTVSAHANTKVGAGVLAALSATGTYWVSYYSDGTNVYISATGALS